MSLMAHLENRRLELQQTETNAAKTARLALAFRSRGSGETKLPVVRFGVTFLEQPAVSSGVVLSSGRLVPTKFPNACAGVYGWVRNKKGYFVGAKVFLVVDSGGQAYDLEHHVTFDGLALHLSTEALDRKDRSISDARREARLEPPGWDR